MNPEQIYRRFIEGASIERIGNESGYAHGYIEDILRAVAVGIDLAKPRCEHDETRSGRVL